jgi:hypothetical protein
VRTRSLHVVHVGAVLAWGGCQEEPYLISVAQPPALGQTVCSLGSDLRLGAGALGCLADGGTRATGEAGTSFAFGDFDGDGLEDAAIGMPGCSERNSSGPDYEQVGAVLVCWGRAPDSNGSCGTADWSCTLLRDPVRDPQGNPIAGARFGQSLAAWEIDGRLSPATSSGPRHELVVGVPGFLDSALDVRMGAVRGFVLQHGPSSPVNAWWSAPSRLPQIPTLPAVGKLEGARLGSALAVGDFSPPSPTSNVFSSIAAGAPGYSHFDAAAVEHKRLGAVEIFHSLDDQIFWNPDYPTPEGNSGSDYRVPDPFIAVGSTVYLPSRICDQPTAGPDDVLADGSGQWCDGAEFGAALATGRLLEDREADEDEDGERDHLADLVVGAPGSPGRVGEPGSGHVEVLSGLGLLGSGTSGPIPSFGDPSDGDLYIDSQVAQTHPGQGAIPWGVHSWDLAPEGSGGPDQAGDRYGAALAVTDLVPTLFADDSTVDHKHWRDELVIGVPGEDVYWEYQVGGTSSGTWLGPAVDAGMFCIYQHGDEDILPVGWEPGDDDDSAPPLPELVGKPDGSVPSERQQYCVGLETNPGVPEGGVFGQPNEYAYLGSSIVAGRLSTWDPDFQVAVGAPGPRYPEPHGPPQGDDDDSAAPGDDDDSAVPGDDDDSAGPGDDDDSACASPPRPGTCVAEVDEGRVYVFHFASVFDEGSVFSVDIANESYASSNTGPRGQGVTPGYVGLTAVHPLPSSPGPTGTPARFGAALGLHDIDCGGHPDLFVGAPDTRLGTAIDDVVVARWGRSLAEHADWFYVHQWEGQIGGETERLKIVVAPTGEGSGYAYLWSDTNDAWSFEIIDVGDDDDSAGDDDDSASSELTPCFAYPFNMVSLEGPIYGVPYSYPGAAVPNLFPCSGVPAPEVEWSTPSGDRWARFGPPRALPLRSFGFAAEDAYTLLQIDLNELGEETGLFALAAAAAAAHDPPFTLPAWPDPWLLDLEIQKVGSTAGSIDLCPALTAVGFPLPTSLLNGEAFPDCEQLNDGVFGTSRWRLSPDAEPLTCDEPWVP